MSEQYEITILPAQPAKRLRIPWTMIEVLETPLKLEDGLQLCLIELTEESQNRHGNNKDLSIAPEWYGIPDQLALGMYDGKAYFLNGQYGFRHIAPTEVKQSIEISLTSEHLLVIEKEAEAWKEKSMRIPIQYTDTTLYNAIQQHIP